MARYYEIDGQLYVSVTTALSIIRKKHLERWRGAVGNEEADEVFEEAGHLGSTVHDYSEQTDRGQTIEKIDDEQIALMIEGYREWVSKYVIKFLYIEKVVYHPVYKYAGRLDRLAVIKGDRLPSVIDLKTGNMGSQEALKEVGLQLSGYKEALEQENIKTKRRLIVHIDKHKPGKIMVKEPPCDHKTDFNMFLYTLQLYRHFNGQKPGEIIKLGGMDSEKCRVSAGK